MPAQREDDIDRFDNWAATYDESPLQRLYFGPVHAAMLDMIGNASPNEWAGNILDIGCGTGRLLHAVAVRWPSARLFGVDPAERMILEATSRNPAATFRVAPAEAIPFESESMDLVVSSLSFHHWADQTRGLREIRRVLRPVGMFVLADHTLWLGHLFNERVRGQRELRALMGGAGLTVRAHRRLWLRFVLVTLAVGTTSA